MAVFVWPFLLYVMRHIHNAGKLESKDNSTNPLVSERQEQSEKLNVSKVFLIIFECRELSTDFVNQQEN